MKTLIRAAAIFSITIFISLFLLFSNGYSFQNEPDGYKGIKWGTDINSVKKSFSPSISPNSTILKNENWSTYKRNNDEMELGAAKLHSITYFFWKGKFTCVEILVYGQDNYNALKEACFERFGKISDIRSKEQKEQQKAIYEMLVWDGDIGMVFLTYFTNVLGEKRGVLKIASTSLGKQVKSDMNDARLKKAKEGAAKGF